MDYDLVVIGAGWAGFNAALRAKELGLKVALVEQEQIGGTCLNRGCIPTKTLIQSAKVLNLTKKSNTFGVEFTTPPQINFHKAQERKDKIILQLRGSLQFMLKGVDFLNGRAQILSNKEVKIGDKAVRAKFILIASGARPMEIPNLRFDGKKIISSDEILNLKEIPKTLLVIGGGVIGCEFASLFNSLGTQVSIIELTPQLIPGQDKELAKKIEVIFRKKGMRINLNSNAVMADLNSYDLVLLCIGRTPNTQNLGLEKLGLKIEKNRITVDEYLKTNIPNVYAAGDCTGRVMLAHFAAYQGRIAAENITHPGSQKRAENAAVPSCIFADPEIASVGLSEEEALGKGIELKINKFDFLGLGMARILDEFEGFVKIISDKKTEQILGASIIGARATELIAILTLAISSHLKLSSIRDTIFAHPTVSESIGEALAEHGI